MAKKFVTEREIAFIHRVNKELIQKVSGQKVYYYAIVPEKSQVNSLYGESIKKVWAPPVEIYGRVRYGNDQVSSSNMGQDTKYNLEVYFHKLELEERNVDPKDGDFIEYGEIIYEITSATKPQVMFGQINNKVMTKCVCVPAREGQFKAGGDSTRGVNNMHEITNTKHKKDFK